MPRLGLGMPIASDTSSAPVVAIDDFLWENYSGSSGEIAINYQETRTNVVLHSQDTTDAEAWTKTNTAIDSTLYEAPDNSTTANAIKSNSTGEKSYNLKQENLSVTAGKTYTLSVHLKKENLSFGQVRFNDRSVKYRADFNLTTAAVTNTGNLIRTQVNAMDDDWYRCSITFKAQNTVSNGDAVFLAQSEAGDSTPNIAVSGIVLIYVWGWQLEENIEASAYIPTVDAARTKTTTLNDFSKVWDFDSANIMPEADPDSEGVWEDFPNIVLNGNYEELGSNLVTNGTFETDSNWTTTTGWTISGGTAICDGSQSANTTLVQQNGIKSVTLNIVNGKTYEVTFDVVVQAGVITYVEVASGIDSTNISSSGTYTKTITASSTNGRLTFAANSDFVGSIDNVTLKQVDPNDRWTLGTGWTISGGKAHADVSSTAALSQTLSTGAGNTYEITVTISNLTAGALQPQFGGILSSPAQINSNGTHTVLITATASSHGLLLYALNTSAFSIDNLTITEYAIKPLNV